MWLLGGCTVVLQANPAAAAPHIGFACDVFCSWHVSKLQVRCPRPTGHPAHKSANGSALSPLLSAADRKDGPQPRLPVAAASLESRTSHAVLGSVQTRAAMVQRIAQTMRAFRMHLGEQWAPLWLSLHTSVQKMLVETYQMTAE